MITNDEFIYLSFESIFVDFILIFSQGKKNDEIKIQMIESL